MSKRQNKNNISIPDIIQLFETCPEKAYAELISSNHFFYSRDTKSFWEAYKKLDHAKLINLFPDSAEIYFQVEWIKLFYGLSELCNNRKSENIKALKALNPDETSLTKAFFLCLELGHGNKPNDFPVYSAESLTAIKRLLKEIIPSLKSKNKTSYSVELVELSRNLIYLQIDISLIKEFLDAFLWADFKMIRKDDSKGFILSLPDGVLKTENLFILNHLKKEVKRCFNGIESQTKISEQEHFKKHDPIYKTQEGLAVWFTSSDVKGASMTPGTTNIQLKDDFILEDLIELFKLQQEQNFHYQCRQVLSQIYQPNDELDIHALHIEICENTYVTLYELLFAMSCLIAKADFFRYISMFPDSVSIGSIKKKVRNAIRQQVPECTEQEEESLINTEIIHLFKKFEEDYKHLKQKFFYFFTEEVIINWFTKIEELKAKSLKELKAIIDLFSDFNFPLPFNPIYKIDEKYYFSYITCILEKFSLNQFLYDFYISDKLFNSQTKSQKDELQKIGESHKNRESKFTNSLKDLFSTITPYVESNLSYGCPKYDFGDLKGEFDVIAYFEKENIIFPIQVKLSNASPRMEKRKKEWITERISNNGVNQVIKDIKLLQSKPGLKFIAEKLKTKNEILSPGIYPLIVSDNFFADHCSFPLNDNTNVTCISYFELKHLILNQKVHPEQADFFPNEGDNKALFLINAIEENLFWNFLNKFAEKFELSKSLSVFIEDCNIEMKV